MNIPSDYRPLDPLARRRQLESGQAPAARQPVSGDVRADAYSTPDTAAIARYAEHAKTLGSDPAKLEALRAALADGSYRADAEELVDPLLARLDPPSRQG